MRQSVAELERSSGKKGAVPITVRQLEAVIRIAGKILKMDVRTIFIWCFRIFGQNETCCIRNRT